MKYKDHITLSECTKADLLWIIKRMNVLWNDTYLDRALNDLWYEKEKQRIAEAEKQSQLANRKQKEYIALLEPYQGTPIQNIPHGVLVKADRAQKAANDAEKKFAKLMGLEV